MRRESIDAKIAADRVCARMMRAKPGTPVIGRTVRDIRRRIRKRHSAEEKIRIALAGLRGEESIVALCRREETPRAVLCSWSKESLEAGKKRSPDTELQANSGLVRCRLLSD